MTKPPQIATEEQIADLVKRFYDKAQADDRLGPMFAATIHDWGGHLKIVEDFWSHAILGTTRYKGHAFAVHTNLPIDFDHFDRWLDLFRTTARETLPAPAANIAIARAEHMTHSFRIGILPFKDANGNPSRTPAARPPG